MITAPSGASKMSPTRSVMMTFLQFEGGGVGEACFALSSVGVGWTVVPTTFDLQLLSAAVESEVLNSRSIAMDFWRLCLKITGSFPILILICEALFGDVHRVYCGGLVVAIRIIVSGFRAFADCWRHVLLGRHATLWLIIRWSRHFLAEMEFCLFEWSCRSRRRCLPFFRHVCV